MSKEVELFDVTIIGGGPVGIYAAFYCGMRQMKTKLIESLPQLGGQLSAIYPEKYIYDIAGHLKIRAQALIDELTEQMNQFSPTICLGEAVTKVEKQEDGTFLLETSKGFHYSKAVILSAGNGAFQPRRLDVSNNEQFESTNLHYLVKNMEIFKDRRVVLFGGGDSAVDWAMMLEPIAKEITIVHRRDQFRAHEHSVEQMRASSVKIKTPFVAHELIGTDQIEKVVIKNVKTEELEVIECDDVIVNYGFVASLGPIKEWGLTIEKNLICVDSKMETNIEGIFAVGDICTYEGRLKLIMSGLGEVPKAANAVKHLVDPNAKIQLHSSNAMAEKK